MAKKNSARGSGRQDDSKNEEQTPAATQLTFDWYKDFVKPNERMRRMDNMQAMTLIAEIELVRLVNGRLVAAVKTIEGNDKEDIELLVRLAQALGGGASRVGRLMRDLRALVGEAADGLTGAVARALDELSTELGIKL